MMYDLFMPDDPPRYTPENPGNTQYARDTAYQNVMRRQLADYQTPPDNGTVLSRMWDSLVGNKPDGRDPNGVHYNAYPQQHHYSPGGMGPWDVPSGQGFNPVASGGPAPAPAPYQNRGLEGLFSWGAAPQRMEGAGMPGAGDLRQLQMGEQAPSPVMGPEGRGNAAGIIKAISPIMMMALAGMYMSRKKGRGGPGGGYRGTQHVFGSNFAY